MSHLSIPIFTATCLFPINALAELNVANIFTDYAVLQRNTSVPVWGTAEAGKKVHVSFAGQQKSVTTDVEGKWRVNLDPLTASFEPQQLTVASEKEQTIFKDILVGEVWICSGQSNMQVAAGAIPESKALIPKAKHIRSFAVPHTVAFTEQDQHAGTWEKKIPNSAVAFTFSHFLQQHAETPVGIILSAWGSSSIEAWMPRDMTETLPHFRTMMEEFDANTEDKQRISSILEGEKPWPKVDDIFLRRQSNILYNAMMHPLIPYANRGLVWYQGERNAKELEVLAGSSFASRNSGMLLYGDALKLWIKRYRKAWGNEKMQFQIVMLPGYLNQKNADPQDPTVKSWAWMRESQLKALDLPHTSVVNTIDLGDVKNIHPKDKFPIGERLALLTARDTLRKAIIAEGPIMRKVEQASDHLIIHFKQASTLQTKDNKAPRGFWISDESQQWFPAKAEIKGQTVILKSEQIKKPLFVRYAFSGKPNVNLVNQQNLPARPFRTDGFKP